MGFNKRGGLFDTYVGWIIITVVAIVLIIGGYMILSGKMQSAAEVIKKFLRF